jgi:hypothetical protein
MSQRSDNPTGSDLLSPEQDRELALALQAAWAPAELDPALNEMLIEAALEDPFAEPSEEEVAESERLRQALDGEGEHPDAALARALALAHAPPGLTEEQNRGLARHALARRSNVIYVAFGAAATLVAAAAAVLLFLFPASRSATPTNRQVEKIAVSRSTVPLFDKKFDTADTTARIDRIASARARDLRRNQYAMWGVR